MSDCRICAASNDGAHVLKLEGDVRLTMCTALDQYFQSMFAEPGFVSVWVDVTEADGLDSTTLGMLAQLAIQTRERFDFRPAIFSTNPSIDRLLDTDGAWRKSYWIEPMVEPGSATHVLVLVDGAEDALSDLWPAEGLLTRDEAIEAELDAATDTAGVEGAPR